MTPPTPHPPSASPGRHLLGGPGTLVWVALATVYVVWGSTYLGIRIVVEELDPLVACGVRFLIAGGLLGAFVRLRNGPGSLRMTRGEVLGGCIVGVLLIAGGNGLVFIAERDIPSNLAALIVAACPLVIVAIRAFLGERSSRATVVGVAIGFAGVAILLLPGRPAEATAAGCLLVLAGVLAWAWGSVLSKRVSLPSDPLASTALQMTAGGAVALPAGLAMGESLSFAGASADTIAAFLYLIFFGSIAAFTAYAWLLQNAPIQLVSTYAYVNPVIAVLLGWAILGETLSAPALAGAAVIVVSVALIVRQEAPRAPAKTAAAAREPRTARTEVPVTEAA